MKHIAKIVLVAIAIVVAAQTNVATAQDLVTGIVVDKYESPIPGVLISRRVRQRSTLSLQ